MRKIIILFWLRHKKKTVGSCSYGYLREAIPSSSSRPEVKDRPHQPRWYGQAASPRKHAYLTTEKRKRK